MSIAEGILDFVFAAARKIQKFNRKTPPGGEPHYFPKEPAQLGLLRGQCFHCLQVNPRGGCYGRPKELA
jgi:hypothetical protein